MQLNPQTKDRLILALIKAEMKNYKLICGLERAGLLVEDFYTGLDWSILDLLGYDKEPQRQQFFQTYDAFMEPLPDMEVSEFNRRLEELAGELLEQLKGK